MYMAQKTILYIPNKRAKTGWIGSWVQLVRNIYEYRELIYQLWRRDFLMQYKKSFLGMGWLIIAPIMGIISWVFMNATGVLAPGDVGIPYPAYILISTSIFGLFMNFYSGAAGTLQAAQGFIMQVNFPHDALLAKQTLQQISSFIITFTVSIIALFAFGVIPSWKLIFFPVMIIPMFFIAASIGLVSSVIQVVFPDIQRVLGFVMSLLMYITPVIYSAKVQNQLLQNVIQYNPLTYLIGGVRDIIIYGQVEHFDRFIYASIGALFVFLFCWRLFYISEEKVIEKMI